MSKALVAASAAPLMALLAACGGQGTATATAPTPTPSSTAAQTPTGSSTAMPASPAPAGPVVKVTINGDDVTPKGDRIKAKVGVPVTFVVTSDRAGGLHVHSSPAQSPTFAQGTTTIEVTIDKPGVVEVEEHESDALIVQLEVR